jgi:diaminopropionate ammonia-lyase
MKCIYQFNPFKTHQLKLEQDRLRAFEADDIMDLHASLPGYRRTPTHRLSSLAHLLGIKEIYVKDESYRFDLNAFKVLGASYAIYRFFKEEWETESKEKFDIRNLFDADGPWAGRYTFCTATDGNHGRAVAWVARRLFQKAVVYMPRGTVEARIENIRTEGAEVRVIGGTYDDAVCKIAGDAEKNCWQVISDTAYPGYMTIPAYIMAGYTTMFKEMESEILRDDDCGLDIVIMQGGVGSFAAAGVSYFYNRYGKRKPKLISVEPTEAACLLESIRTANGEPTSSKGSFKTIMAGLNCGTPSHLAWPILREGIDLFLAIPDKYAIKAMRQYYNPVGDDPHVISGESGAAGLGALLALLKNDSLCEAKEKLGLGPDSRILIFNTEGATDPVGFNKIISEN